MSAQGFIEVCQDGPVLQTQRLHYAQNALHKTATPFAAAAKTTLPPQHRTTQDTLGVIIRRPHTRHKGKCPQRRLPRQQLPACALCRRAPAAQIATQLTHHVRSNRPQYLTLEPFPAADPIPNLRPMLEQYRRQRQQVLAYPPTYTRALGQGTKIADVASCCCKRVMISSRCRHPRQEEASMTVF
jgi:hypothetical protein